MLNSMVWTAILAMVAFIALFIKTVRRVEIDVIIQRVVMICSVETI